MNLATQTYIPEVKLGFEAGMVAIKKAGFDSVDLSLFRMDRDDNIYLSSDWKAIAKERKGFLDEIGLACHQAHAPHIFDFGNETVLNGVAIPRILRSMEVARIFGAKCIVIHPLHHLDYRTEAKKLREINKKYLASFLPLAKELDIVIGYENMWQRDIKRGFIIPSTGGLAKELAEDIDSFDTPYIRACLDVGHSSLTGEEAQNAIRILGRERLVALHIHDNDYKEDLHTIPYLGKMDWDEIMSALDEIGYSGDFTYEADSFLKNIDKGLIADALVFMAAIGRYLISKTTL